MPEKKPNLGRDVWLRLGAAALLGLAALAAMLLLPVADWLRAALRLTSRLGWWGPILLSCLYIVTTVLALPGVILTLGAGAAFGVAMGVAIVSIGSTLGATAAFLVGRHVARDWLRRRIEQRPRFQAVDEAVREDGFRIVLLTRLSPVFPFVIMNYVYGLTSVRLRTYVLASWLGLLPGTVLYVWIGTFVQMAALHEPDEFSLWQWVLYAVGLAATAAVTVLVTRKARKAIERRLERDADEDEDG